MQIITRNSIKKGNLDYLDFPFQSPTFYSYFAIYASVLADVTPP